MIFTMCAKVHNSFLKQQFKMKIALKAKKTFDQSIVVTFFEALQLKLYKSCKTLNRGGNN